MYGSNNQILNEAATFLQYRIQLDQLNAVKIWQKTSLEFFSWPGNEASFEQAVVLLM